MGREESRTIEILRELDPSWPWGGPSAPLCTLVQSCHYTQQSQEKNCYLFEALNFTQFNLLLLFFAIGDVQLGQTGSVDDRAHQKNYAGSYEVEWASIPACWFRFWFWASEMGPQNAPRAKHFVGIINNLVMQWNDRTWGSRRQAETVESAKKWLEWVSGKPRSALWQAVLLWHLRLSRTKQKLALGMWETQLEWSLEGPDFWRCCLHPRQRSGHL